MNTLLRISVLVLSMLTGYAAAQSPVPLPDPTLTPGEANPDIIADPSGASHIVNGLEANMCAKTFRTGPYRHTSSVLKKAVCAEYHATNCPNPKLGEIDHLVPLEVGGADVLANLWWQPAPSYHVKDKVENATKKAVCLGRLTLQQGQQGLSGDWCKFGLAQGFITSCTLLGK